MAKTLLAVLAATGITIALALYEGLPTRAGAAVSSTDDSNLPPVEQTLVREGDFAFALAPALKLGEPRSEAEAEEMLAEAGIAPASGWISDYPVTPSVIGDIRDAVKKAAAEGRIALDAAEADKAVLAVADDFGLPALAEAEEAGQTERAQAETVPDYYDEARLEEYYYDYGPPVLTYYEPPYSYGYLYDYVYDPFFCWGHYFPGYYVLQNFTIVVDGGKRGHKRHRDWNRVGDGRRDRGSGSGTAVVSNEVVDPATGQASVVDPVTRETVSPVTERSRREARRTELAAGGTGTARAERLGFTRAREERAGRDNEFRDQPSAASAGGTAVLSGPGSDARALRRDLGRREAGRRDRGGATGLTSQPATRLSGTDEAERVFGGGRDAGISSRTTSGGGGDNDRRMSVRGWTFGTARGDSRPDSARSFSAPSGTARSGFGGRDMSTNTGYRGGGREVAPGGGGFSSGRSSGSSAPSYSAPMTRPSPSFASPSPSGGFGGGREMSRGGGGSFAPSGRSVERPSFGGGRGGHDLGGPGRGGGGSCRGRNC